MKTFLAPLPSPALPTLVSLASLLAFADWYVDKSSPNCPSGTGTQAAPFCTITEALATAASGDTIHVAPGVYLESLTINNDVTLIGTAGQLATIVDGHQAGRVVDVPGNNTVVIDGFTLRNGMTMGAGGGIYSNGVLNLISSTVSGNTALGFFGSSGSGGGVYSQGTLTLLNSTVSGNTAGGSWYGGHGGGIYANGPLTMLNSAVLNNAVFFGAGGIHVSYGSTVSIENSTISGNASDGLDVYSVLSIANSTVSGNTGRGVSTWGPATLLNVTITNNTSRGWTVSGGAAQVRNSIIAGNSTDVSGPFTSLGHNLIGDDTGSTGFTNGVSGDLVGTLASPLNPLLAPLANNGGPTQTHALLPGSPAIDAGDPVIFEPTDQRGVLRPPGSTDIGAFEVGVWMQNFCTAGTTSHGCTAAISATGSPSASATSGFMITVNNVEGQRSGIIFYGLDNTGFSPLAWGAGSSFMCVKSPLQRMNLQPAGGTLTQCDGSLSMDWNAFRAANPSALGAPFSSGGLVYAQAWFRDPASPKTTALSDALVFVVLP